MNVHFSAVLVEPVFNQSAKPQQITKRKKKHRLSQSGEKFVRQYLFRFSVEWRKMAAQVTHVLQTKQFV